MPYRYRAFAIDYDGTLTAADQPHADVLAAVAAVRKSGRRVILVTGRIMDELLAVFPDVLAHFDHVVAENGCVLVEGGGGRKSLAPEIDATLSSRLQRHGRATSPRPCTDRDAGPAFRARC
jgi:hydroxymethylpyrimidine pyrophosphatase-like HAD family hydrolase